ncbi:MAG: response regulator [Bacteroidetes bacterium]|nr:response regulator [Bacteroidota bacterium]
MRKSRLFWKVLGYFAILLLILTALTYIINAYIQQIEKNFAVATSDVRNLSVIEELRNCIVNAPRSVFLYSFTKSDTARVLYLESIDGFEPAYNAVSKVIKDSLTLDLLAQVRSNFYKWNERVGTPMIQATEAQNQPGEVLRILGELQHIDLTEQYIQKALNLVNSIYHSTLRNQTRAIETAVKQSKDLSFYVVFVNVLLAVFALVLGFVLTHSITKPIGVVKQGAQHIMEGKFTQITINRADEIGELARVFNQMSRILGENYTRLQAYSELVTTLNNLKGIEEIQKRSLQLLCEHTRSALGALYFFNKTEHILSLTATYGFISDGTRTKLLLGEGIPGECALERKPLVLRDIPPTTEYVISTGIFDIVPRTVIARPILFQEELLGVLILASTTEYEPAHMEILNNSIPQLAVAINNAINDEATQKLSLEIAQRNEELNAKNAELEEAYRVKSNFLASMSHELRTPLNSIIGFSQVLLSEAADPLTDEQRIAIEKVLKNGKHLLQLINDILDLSKIEAGRMTVNIETEDIQSIISNSVLTIEPMLKQKGLQLTTEINSKIKALQTDIVKVKQILMNLLSNAVKFTEKGGITIRVYDKDAMVAFAVQDTGIGIEKKNLELIFKEFQQVDSSSTRKYQGTGLGLAIARRLARMLGGDLVAESIVGQGTTFTLTLPPVYVAKKGEEKIQTGGAEFVVQAEKKQIQDLVTSAGGTRILCIDDDPDVLDILRKYLTPEGYTVECATSGDEGIALARKHKPSLITLDIMMPEKDGWQVLRELKQLEETKNIPVIIHSIIDNKPLALSLGAVDFLTKPAEPRTLLEVVTKFCQSKSQSILVVDDNEDFAQTIKQLLSRDYRDVRIAYNGKQALEMLQRFTPALILLDLAMPEMDGFEVVSHLHNDERYRHIPVVILSGKDVSQQEMAKLREHISEFIQKGELANINLSAAVKRILQQQGVKNG